MPILLLCLLLTGVLPRPGAPPPAAPLAPSRAGDAEPLDEYAPVLSALLAEVVTDEGLVRYDRLRGPLNADFRRVLKTIETFDATTLSTDAEKRAFWINAYNVQMLQHILETPQVQDIVADGYVDRFFRTPYRTAGMDLTLDQIEHVILRRQNVPPDLAALPVDTLDFRIHVGLNCAAVSCPRLRRHAFTPATLDAELDAAMRDFASDPAHLRLDGDTLVLSALLDWFGDDFEADGRPVGDVILGYMAADRPDHDALRAALRGQTAAALRARPDVRFAYRWTVNRAR
ncbi:DUF547 domain-containing protein [Rhodothermaceae bacterium RA]|nr:DUF547 domain-containing protein [Rhodothermaceae bacterium RA]